MKKYIIFQSQVTMVTTKSTHVLQVEDEQWTTRLACKMAAMSVNTTKGHCENIQHGVWMLLKSSWSFGTATQHSAHMPKLTLPRAYGDECVMLYTLHRTSGNG